ncbi:DUF4357 domain-containing protein (plasmid) [Streptomyces sp. NBC_01369]|nr:DUF4357 domain-containing protein [Streptomyces sp. NBC_00892]
MSYTPATHARSRCRDRPSLPTPCCFLKLLGCGPGLQRRANRSGRAVVTAEGQLIVDGHSSPFPSPSKAAEAITGNVINGWTLWQTPDGSTLDQLRQRLDAE